MLGGFPILVRIPEKPQEFYRLDRSHIRFQAERPLQGSNRAVLLSKLAITSMEMVVIPV
jgi:hypothetical protein